MLRKKVSSNDRYRGNYMSKCGKNAIIVWGEKGVGSFKRRISNEGLFSLKLFQNELTF
jgi:hypothetical protein